jgi:hypothetical protein
LPFVNVTVKTCSPTNSSSVRKSTVGSLLLARWKLCRRERSPYYVLYSLVLERIDALSDAVRQFVSEERPRRAAG